VPVDTPRKVTVDEAKKILNTIPDEIERFLVIMPRSTKEALDLCWRTNPDVVQLHGQESLSFVRDLKRDLPCKLAKTIHVQDHTSLERAVEYSEYSDYLLLDTPSKIGGGSGKTHDWKISRRIVELVDVPVIMSGGLNPSNVVDAVSSIRPSYVDSSSGIEAQPGKKDLGKVKKFIEMAKSL
jgi:phosphoribosylanthranilate isomerase